MMCCSAADNCLNYIQFCKPTYSILSLFKAETVKSAVAYKPSQDIYQPVAEEPFYSTIKKHAHH